MMKVKRKLFAVLLSALMAVTMMPGMVFAEIDNISHEVEVDASASDQELNRGAIESTNQSGLGVIAVNGHTATVNIDGAITTSKFIREVSRNAPNKR